MEKCQRCGEEGEDRRTLWHDCMYAMNELNVPFNQLAIDGVCLERTGTEVTTFGHKLPVWEDPEKVRETKKNQKHSFFTLRVCKDCRAQWMGAISKWFHDVPAKESCGSGIFVRRNGATVEISEEEWDRENPDREPVRVLPERRLCAYCHQGRHSSKGPPEYGDSDACPDERCQCDCRRK